MRCHALCLKVSAAERRVLSFSICALFLIEASLWRLYMTPQYAAMPA